MTDQRDRDGRFKKGAASPNKRGRPRGRSSRIETLADADAVTVKVANMRVPYKVDGRQVYVTQYERLTRSLLSGNPANRLAVERGIQVMRQAFSETDRRRQKALAEEERQRKLKRARGDHDD